MSSDSSSAESSESEDEVAQGNNEKEEKHEVNPSSSSPKEESAEVLKEVSMPVGACESSAKEIKETAECDVPTKTEEKEAATETVNNNPDECKPSSDSNENTQEADTSSKTEEIKAESEASIDSQPISAPPAEEETRKDSNLTDSEPCSTSVQDNSSQLEPEISKPTIAETTVKSVGSPETPKRRVSFADSPTQETTDTQSAAKFAAPTVGTTVKAINNDSQISNEANSRVVYNAVPAMNSQSQSRTYNLESDFSKLSFRNEPNNIQKAEYFPEQVYNPPRSSFNRAVPINKINIPSWYTPAENLIPNTVTPVSKEQFFGYPAREPTRVEQRAQVSSPTRKLSASTPYIGSHVIAAETGPSLTVMLRRQTNERQWGFTFYGGSEFGCPPFVNKVTKNSLAFHHGFEVGDVIVSISKTLTVGKTYDQLKAEILRAGNDLDLVLIRRGVDLMKLQQIVPQVFQSSVRSPPPSEVGTSPDFNYFDDSSSRASQPVARGRSFRNVKTKSLRILEEQLETGQAPHSVMIKRQAVQNSRTIPSGASSSTFTHAYGQNPHQSLASRPLENQPPVGVNWSPTIRTGQQFGGAYSQPVYGAHSANPYKNQPPSSWGYPTSEVGTSWDTHSEVGSQWSPRSNWYSQPQSMYHDPYAPISRNPYDNSTSMTVTIPAKHIRYGRPM